jgi:DNA (cytosine-5)-methyltransferase 1
VLDLYSKAGGAGTGYHLAGYDVVGVDIEHQPRYPFTFQKDDALLLLRCLIDGGSFVTDDGSVYSLRDFDLMHASPPCQERSRATGAGRKRHPRLIGPTRSLLDETGLPYVIESVPPAPGTEYVRPDLVLCGCMFPQLGGRLRRERWFETSPQLFDLRPSCWHVEQPVSVLRHGARVERSRRNGQSHSMHVPTAEAARLMGIGWMTQDELGEAIPPAYTEHIGRMMLQRWPDD